jgi:inhibitor of cysteine peptidase
MGNSGYVVTFKETDPLYVLDLSNASAPKVVGELKIPGYSSYLHPLTDTLLVGIGKEDAQVKVSLFDVSNPGQPTEVGKYLLTDYWSQIMSTHHAFLQDAKHHLFFLPGDKGGYVFGYENNTLKLIKAIEGTGIKRALYINDNLYLVADNKMTVVSETDWKTVDTLEW